VRDNMQIEGMIKRLKDASRNIFKAGNTESLRKRYIEPHVFVRIDGKKVKIKDITVSECNIYLETEE
jgi:hypothetical protein